MKRLTIVLILVAAFLWMPSPRADEGMWTFDNPPIKLWKEKYGFDATPAWLEHVRLASTRLSDGASGSFVSPDGLLLTNQHVAAGQLLKVSSKDQDFTRDGFYAPSRDKELKCPDLEVNVLVSYEDVTGRVQGAARPGMADKAAGEARRAEVAAIEKESTDRTGMTSDVVTLYNGAEYWVYRYRKYTDIRLVFAPEEQTAFFGGDYDNFTYPRFDLDIAFFRVYENGQPARTPHFFKWSTSGAGEKELVFLPGNPGSTARLLTLAQIQYQRDAGNPLQMQVWTSRRDALARYAATGAEAARRAGAARRSLENSIKRLVGQQAGLNNPRIMGKKEAEEKALRASVTAKPDLLKRFGTAWGEIARAYKAYPAHARRIAFSTLAPSRLGAMATTLALYAEELPKPNAQRYDEFRESRLESLKFGLLSPAPVYTDMEEAVLAGWLDEASKSLGAADPFVKATLGGEDPASVAKKVIQGTKLTEVAVRKALIEGGPSAIAGSDDPLLAPARRIVPITRQLRAWQEQNITSVETSAGERIGKARFAVYGKTVYPDANFTLRIEYGTVLGYEEGTTLVPFKTTFAGLYDRAASFNDKSPFDLPRRWKDRKSALDLGTPLNFAYSADTIGGNSGSPVINRQAELVGVNFDGNIQKLANRYLYVPEEEGSRAVGVHSAGIVEALSKVYDAHQLVAELLARPVDPALLGRKPDDLIKPVKARFAPDPRLSVFNVATERKGDALLVKGEVGSAEARDAVSRALAEAGYHPSIDDLKVLPDPALGAKRLGIVRVSVAHIRSRPSQFADQVDEWLMGETLLLLRQQGGWYYAQRDGDNYVGWIEGDHVFPTDEAGVAGWTSSPRLMTTAPLATVRERPEEAARPVTDLVAADTLKAGQPQKKWVAVELPDGRKGFVERAMVTDLAAWQKTAMATPSGIEATAVQFMGVPYIWGGTSAKGFDCSGFTKTVFRMNNVILPRDADQQAETGEAVSLDNNLSNLRKGDVLYFKRSAASGTPDDITHVGIFLGNMEFIHASGLVKRNSFDPKSAIYSESLLKRLVKVKRYIK